MHYVNITGKMSISLVSQYSFYMFIYTSVYTMYSICMNMQEKVKKEMMRTLANNVEGNIPNPNITGLVVTNAGGGGTTSVLAKTASASTAVVMPSL